MQLQLPRSHNVLDYDVDGDNDIERIYNKRINVFLSLYIDIPREIIIIIFEFNNMLPYQIRYTRIQCKVMRVIEDICWVFYHGLRTESFRVMRSLVIRYIREVAKRRDEHRQKIRSNLDPNYYNIMQLRTRHDQSQYYSCELLINAIYECINPKIIFDTNDKKIRLYNENNRYVYFFDHHKYANVYFSIVWDIWYIWAELYLTDKYRRTTSYPEFHIVYGEYSKLQIMYFYDEYNKSPFQNDSITSNDIITYTTLHHTIDQ